MFTQVKDLPAPLRPPISIKSLGENFMPWSYSSLSPRGKYFLRSSSESNKDIVCIFSSGGLRSTLSLTSNTICCIASTFCSASDIATVLSINLSSSSSISTCVYSFFTYSSRTQASISTSTASIAKTFSCSFLSRMDSLRSSKEGSSLKFLM